MGARDTQATTVQRSRKRWLVQAVCGLLLTGVGLSSAIDAGFARAQGNDWMLYGTLALVMFQAGLCLLIDSIRYKE